MIAPEKTRCTLVAPGIEIATEQTGAGAYVTTIHAPGYIIDGERFVARTRLGSMILHKSATGMAQTVAESEQR